MTQSHRLAGSVTNKHIDLELLTHLRTNMFVRFNEQQMTVFFFFRINNPSREKKIG